MHFSVCPFPLKEKLFKHSLLGRALLTSCPHRAGKGLAVGTVKPEAATFAPQSSLAQWGASAAMQVVSRRQSEVRVPWLHNLAASQDEDHDEQTDTEGEEAEQEDESETEEKQLSEVRRPHGPAGHGGLMHRATG